MNAIVKSLLEFNHAFEIPKLDKPGLSNEELIELRIKLLKEEVDDIKTLDQSYRIPGGPIHELSQKIIGQVQNRFDKSYRPREEHGVLKRYSDITQVDMSEGNWLVLSSANHFFQNHTPHQNSVE